MNVYQEIIATSRDGILVRVDIAEELSIDPILKEMANTVQSPFILSLAIMIMTTVT